MKIKVDGEEKVDDMSLSESDKKVLRAQEEREQEVEKAYNASSNATKNQTVAQAPAKPVAVAANKTASAPAGAVLDKPTGTVTPVAQTLQ